MILLAIDSFVEWVFIILVFGFPVVVGVVAAAYYYFFGYLIAIRDIRWFRLFRYFTPLEAATKEWLEKHSSFYQSLSPRYKRRMARRVNFLLLELDIQGLDIKVNDEAKLMLATTYAQMTIGLSTPWLKRNKKIILYEHAQPREDNLWLHYTSFVAGFNNGQDGMNEGIKFLFHAMRDENQFRMSQRLRFIFDSKILNVWRGAVHEEIQRIYASGFNSYTTGVVIDPEDFMALTMVYFFEMPEKLQQRHQRLYLMTKKLMNWDPIHKTRVK